MEAVTRPSAPEQAKPAVPRAPVRAAKATTTPAKAAEKATRTAPRPAGESALGPDLSELVTDRSDASGTAYWSPADGEYDHDLLTRALGHDAALPRVLGPSASVPGPGFLVGPGAEVEVAVLERPLGLLGFLVVTVG